MALLCAVTGITAAKAATNTTIQDDLMQPSSALNRSMS
jgi:hypothetical protein